MVVGNLKKHVEALRDRNLVISNATKKYLGRESWSPIMAALLLSGIHPSTPWVDVASAEGHRDDRPISQRDLFVERLSASRRPERGLDNELILSDSLRFKCAENILLLWDQVCSEHNDYPIDLPPKEFAIWLWGMNRQGHVHIPDSFWLDAFVNNYQLKHFNKVVPTEVLTWLTAESKKAWELSPKHKFGREVAMARFEAKQAGDPSDDPDEILSRLAEMMRRGGIPGVKLLRYSRKSDIQYRHEGKRDACTLRRDSFARQLRRMIAKEETSTDPSSSPVPSGEYFPQIKPVAISPGVINRFTSNEQLTELARDLLRETIGYVRLAASLRVSDAGWPRDVAILVGYVVRLAKLLTSIDVLAAFKLKEALVLTIPLAIETMVDLKYLIENIDAKLVDSYVGIPAKKGSKKRTGWADLDLEQKAQATGFSDVYTDALQDAPFHLRGSWKDLTEYHLSPVGDERYRAKLSSTEPNPRPLIAVSMLAIIVIQSFSNVIASGPVIEKLQNGLKDLSGRLKIAEEEFDNSLYERW